MTNHYEHPPITAPESTIKAIMPLLPARMTFSGGTAGQWHVVRVEQYHGEIRLLFDGQESYRYVDNGTVGGPTIETGGKFAFRQQNNLYRGDYRNLKVFALE